MIDVFISFSTRDTEVAEKVYDYLTQRDINCWICTRSLKAGDDWAAKITEAISECKIFLIVYSSNAAESNQIPHEIGLASSRSKILIPYRIDDTPLSGSFEYHLMNSHWIQADIAHGDFKLDSMYEIMAGILGKDTAEGGATSDKSAPVFAQRVSATGSMQQTTVYAQRIVKPDKPKPEFFKRKEKVPKTQSVSTLSSEQPAAEIPAQAVTVPQPADIPAQAMAVPQHTAKSRKNRTKNIIGGCILLGLILITVLGVVLVNCVGSRAVSYKTAFDNLKDVNYMTLKGLISVEQRDIYDTLYRGLIDRQKNISLACLDNDTQEARDSVNQTLNYLIDDVPMLECMVKSYTINKGSVAFEYYDLSEINEAFNLMTQEINNFNSIYNDTDEQSVIKNIYKYISSNFTKEAKSADFVGFLKNKSGDSRRYSWLFRTLCKEKGLQCKNVSYSIQGSVTTERCNAAYLGGQWLYFDIYTDDTDDDSVCAYKYFAISEDMMFG